MSSSVHIDNKKKDILILGKGPTQGFDDVNSRSSVNGSNDTSIVNGSNDTKYVSLTNQKCTTQPTIINLHPYAHTQGLYYYPFVVKLDICVGSCNTLNGLCNKVCVPSKTEDLSMSKHVQHDYRNE